jgi:hypothetical protein
MESAKMSIDEMNNVGQEEADQKKKEHSTNPFVRDMLSGGKEIDDATRKLSRLSYTIKPLLPETARLIVIYGAPGGGKSFTCIDMGLSIATGRAYHGMRVKKKSVLYVAAEGSTGVLIRVRAWQVYHELSSDELDGFHILTRPILIDDEKTYAQAFNAIKELEPLPEVVFLDTVARSMTGDENSTRDMNAFVNACDKLGREIGAQIIPIHHTGKNQKKGPRGAIALTGATDTMFEISYNDSGEKREITMNCYRQKDQAKNKPIVFSMVPVNTSIFDADGDEYDSLVPILDMDASQKKEADDKSEAIANKKVKGLCKSYVTASRAFDEMLSDKGVPPPEEVANYMARRIAVTPETKVLHEKDWDEHMLKIGISMAEKDKSRQTAVRRAKEGLVAKGKFDTYDGYFWRTA